MTRMGRGLASQAFLETEEKETELFGNHTPADDTQNHLLQVPCHCSVVCCCVPFRWHDSSVYLVTFPTENAIIISYCFICLRRF